MKEDNVIAMSFIILMFLLIIGFVGVYAHSRIYDKTYVVELDIDKIKGLTESDVEVLRLSCITTCTDNFRLGSDNDMLIECYRACNSMTR